MWDSISPMERGILMGIVMGSTSARSCQVLNIGIKAYDRHRVNILKKLNCHTDVELTWKALTLGWVQFTGRGHLANGPVWVGGNKEVMEAMSSSL